MKLLDAQLAVGMKFVAAAFAREHGVSVRTVLGIGLGYELRASGIRGHGAHIRARPRHPQDLQAWILKLRDDLGVDNGADYVGALHETMPVSSRRGGVPASRRSTGSGPARQVAPQPGQAASSSWRRFAYARPRDCYQQDGTGVVSRRRHQGSDLRRARRLHPSPGRYPGPHRRDRPGSYRRRDTRRAGTGAPRPCGSRTTAPRSPPSPPTGARNLDVHAHDPQLRHPTDPLQPLPPTDLREDRTPPPNPQKMRYDPGPTAADHPRPADTGRRIPRVLQQPPPRRPTWPDHPDSKPGPPPSPWGGPTSPPRDKPTRHPPPLHRVRHRRQLSIGGKSARASAEHSPAPPSPRSATAAASPSTPPTAHPSATPPIDDTKNYIPFTTLDPDFPHQTRSKTISTAADTCPGTQP